MEIENDDVTANVQIDMERLPHLLVEIAEKNNINLSDPDGKYQFTYFSNLQM